MLHHNIILFFIYIGGGETSEKLLNVTLLPNSTQSSVMLMLRKDKIAEQCMLNLYIPSATYELGVQGSVLQATVVVKGTIFPCMKALFN